MEPQIQKKKKKKKEGFMDTSRQHRKSIELAPNSLSVKAKFKKWSLIISLVFLKKCADARLVQPSAWLSCKCVLNLFVLVFIYALDGYILYYKSWVISCIISHVLFRWTFTNGCLWFACQSNKSAAQCKRFLLHRQSQSSCQYARLWLFIVPLSIIYHTHLRTIPGSSASRVIKCMKNNLGHMDRGSYCNSYWVTMLHTSQ